MIFPTPERALIDHLGRPTFLWDVDVDVETFLARLADPDEHVRGYWLGKLLRQAKPDDVPRFASIPSLRREWPLYQRFLGRERAMWHWLLFESGWNGQ